MSTAFDPAKVTITRQRFSTTQGEVLLEYDGKRIEQYGDNIRLGKDGTYEGEDDAYWMEAAERHAIARGLATNPDPVIPVRDADWKIGNFDPEKVLITRKWVSPTEIQVVLEYDGVKLGRFPNAITPGKKDRHDDAHWTSLAERQAVALGLSLHSVPVFTGRHGDAAREVEAGGQDYLLVESSIDAVGHNAASVHVFGPGTFAVGDEDALVTEKFDEHWVTWVTMRAWNPEDAFRNHGGALCQSRAHTDGVDDWETVPFLNEIGEFTPNGGEGEYAAYNPDETARHGMTRPELFAGQPSVIGYDDLKKTAPTPSI